ncbi:MAG TPA: ABC transporter ATP-binding protein [Pyrinomonadaceae bacterium]|nr:ABC transporter ATP-binding protein [Pyrinomonadaceae bacterium]
MEPVVVSVEGVSKRYRIGRLPAGYDSFRESLSRAVVERVRRLRRADEMDDDPTTLWALRDVTFEVRRGEILGIVGRNGAGKSTLLKILSRITRPSTGRVEIYGRVGSLLEVGTGFHPELTGRENIFLNGAILGMSRADIQRRFDEILDFSEVGKFVDTPVKRYSSGMYLRLAFAVAAHLEPDILLVDEVLAVGDAAFQKKCLGKMRDVSSRGRTVLLVSHNMTAIRSLSSHVALLSGGRLEMFGGRDECIAAYLKGGGQPSAEARWDDQASAPGDATVRIKAVRAYPSPEAGADALLAMSTPVEVEVDYWVLEPGARVHITLMFTTDQGVVAFTTGSGQRPEWEAAGRAPGLYRSVCHIPAHLLNEGGYEVKLFVIGDRARVLFELDRVVGFEVKDTSDRGVGAWYGREPGPVRPRLPWDNFPLGTDAEAGAGPAVSAAQEPSSPAREQR